MNLEDPVAVYQARNNVVLHQLTDVLKNAGIESYANEDVSGAWAWVGGIIESFFKAQIFVARKDADRAASILGEYESRLKERAPSSVEGRTAVQVECPECHEPGWFPVAHVGTVQECPHCQAFMDIEMEQTPEEDWGEPEEDTPEEE